MLLDTLRTAKLRALSVSLVDLENNEAELQMLIRSDIKILEALVYSQIERARPNNLFESSHVRKEYNEVLKIAKEQELALKVIIAKKAPQDKYLIVLHALRKVTFLNDYFHKHNGFESYKHFNLQDYQGDKLERLSDQFKHLQGVDINYQEFTRRWSDHVANTFGLLPIACEALEKNRKAFEERIHKEREKIFETAALYAPSFLMPQYRLAVPEKAFTPGPDVEPIALAPVPRKRRKILP